MFNNFVARVDHLITGNRLNILNPRDSAFFFFDLFSIQFTV